jgi:hypothetical protein
VDSTCTQRVPGAMLHAMLTMTLVQWCWRHSCSRDAACADWQAGAVVARCMWLRNIPARPKYAAVVAASKACHITVLTPTLFLCLQPSGRHWPRPSLPSTRSVSAWSSTECHAAAVHWKLMRRGLSNISSTQPMYRLDAAAHGVACNAVASTWLDVGVHSSHEAQPSTHLSVARMECLSAQLWHATAMGISCAYHAVGPMLTK